MKDHLFKKSLDIYCTAIKNLVAKNMNKWIEIEDSGTVEKVP